MPYWYTQSSPIEVKGGIKAQTKRGNFGQNWWAKRWIAVLDNYDIGERLERGKRYARKGQVESLKIEDAIVTASVQGSERHPYKIIIRIEKISKEDWKRLIKQMFEQPSTISDLLAGQMPDNIEKVFEDAGLSLFPDYDKDLEMDCNCYDWANPCKHIAAVFLLLGEEFDRDPFLLFSLRGATREDVLDMAGLKALPGMDSDENLESVIMEGVDKMEMSGEEKKLSTEPVRFWGSPNKMHDLAGSIRSPVDIPKSHAALVKQLGNFPFWASEEMFMPTMADLYKTASDREMSTVMGHWAKTPDESEEAKTEKKTKKKRGRPRGV